MTTTPPALIESLVSRIYVIRGQRVMLDRDLAELYEVETKALKQAVRRKVEALEAKYDQQFKVVFDALKKLLGPSAARGHRQPKFFPPPAMGIFLTGLLTKWG